MYQTDLCPIVRDRLARADLPLLEDVEIDSYLYEVIAELPDADAKAYAEGLKLRERTGYQTPILRSVLARAVRLIECDLVLTRFQ